MIRTCPKGHISGIRQCPQCGAETTPTRIIVNTKDDKEKRSVRELRRMGRI